MLKLGWVHQVHTLNPSCEPTALRPRAGPCSGAHWCRVVAVPRTCRTLYRRAGRRVACLQRRIMALLVSCRACLVIQPGGPAARCIATHKAAPSSNTTLYPDFRQPGRTRSRCGPYRSLPLDRVPALLGRVMAQFSRIVAEPA